MSFNIEFDFRFDTSGFFTNAARAALDFAAGLWEDVIQDDFMDVSPGVDFTVNDPSGSGARRSVTLEEPIDDVRIFVGANSPPFGTQSSNALAAAGFSGFDARGSVFNSRIGNNFRGDGPVTDFEPFAGTISLDPTPSVPWSFALNSPTPNATDFVTVAAHEIGHVLGIGISGIFKQRGAGQGFDGPNARAVNNGDPIPLESDLGHIVEGFAGNSTLMDPFAPPPGTRIAPTDFDLALLAGTGFEVEGFEAQGSTPPIATNEGETIFGTVVDDVIDGMGGDDQLQGNDGDDVLEGGAGVDRLFGQAGDDLLIGGPGDDSLFGEAGADSVLVAPGDGNDTFNDFELGVDRVQVDAAFGFSDADAVLDTVSKPFNNVSRLNLDPETSLEIFHESQAGSPFTTDDIVIVNQTPTENQTPRTGDDSVQTTAAESVTINVLANDSDPDGDALSIQDVGAPANGEVVITDNNAVRYTPNAGFTGLDSFTYRVSDGNGGSASAQVRVDVRSDVAPDTLTDVTELYVAMFDRAPDEGGLQFWVDNLTNGPLPDTPALAEAMFATNAARAQFPTDLTNDQIVERFFENTLGREPDTGGLAFWSNELDNADGVGPVIKSMIDSVRNFDPSDVDDPVVAQAGETSQELFANKIDVAEYFAVDGPGTVAGAEVVLDSISADDVLSSDAAIEAIVAEGLGENFEAAGKPAAPSSNPAPDEGNELTLLGLASSDIAGAGDLAQASVL